MTTPNPLYREGSVDLQGRQHEGQAHQHSSIPLEGVTVSSDVEYEELPDEHSHFSQRSPWLRAAVLGANDGLVSNASLMLGIGGGTAELRTVVLAGVAGLVAGSLSMACGEYISVSSQKDSEKADIEQERREQVLSWHSQVLGVANIALASTLVPAKRPSTGKPAYDTLQSSSSEQCIRRKRVQQLNDTNWKSWRRYIRTEGYPTTWRNRLAVSSRAPAERADHSKLSS